MAAGESFTQPLRKKYALQSTFQLNHLILLVPHSLLLPLLAARVLRRAEPLEPVPHPRDDGLGAQRVVGLHDDVAVAVVGEVLLVVLVHVVHVVRGGGGVVKIDVVVVATVTVVAAFAADAEYAQ